jgi:biotin carboxyl carrier protein
MRYYFVNDTDVIFDITKAKKKTDDLYEIEVADSKKQLTKVLIRKLANKFYISHDGKSWQKIAALNSPDSVLHINTHYKVFKGFKPSTFATQETGDLVTQMPGKVVKVIGEVGQKVSTGQTLVILEAMKMENEIKSNADGIIKSINVKAGQALEAGFTMMEIEVAE